MRIANDGPIRVWFGTGKPLDLASNPPIVGDEDGVGPMVELTDCVTSIGFESDTPSPA